MTIDRLDWSGVPPHLIPGLYLHIEAGRRTGSFIEALLANDLRLAVTRADDKSLAALRPLVLFLHNQAPQGCWGSSAAVVEWRARGGLIGRRRATSGWTRRSPLEISPQANSSDGVAS